MALANDLKNLRVHGSASADELRDFIAKMKGRNPQEVMGLVAGSSLVQSTLQATFATIVIAAVFTVGPYMLAKNNPSQKATAASSKETKPADNKSEAAAKPDSATQVNSAPPAITQGTEPSASSGNSNVDKAAKAMGIGETKSSDPKKNPLENNLDKLLDDVK